jgi:predicted Na+-dependent transporter
MNFHLSSNNLRRLKEYKPILIGAIKILVLFVAALYLLGFTLFPLLGVGNYQLVRIDALLLSEWVMLICLSGALFAWSFRCLVKLSRESLSKKRDTAAFE